MQCLPRGFKLGRLYDCWDTSTLYISNFLYLLAKVRSVPWPLHYKSMEKMELALDTCVRIGTVHIFWNQWWLGTAAMTKMLFLANSLLKGHQRSLETTNSFFNNNSWFNRDITLGWLRCVCLIKTRRLICNMTYFGHYVTLTSGQTLTFTF